MYKAQYRGEDVAVKMMMIDESDVEKLNREIEIMSKLRSPFIVLFVGAAVFL